MSEQDGRRRLLNKQQMYNKPFISFILLFFLNAILVDCMAQKKPEKAEFEFPAAMKEAVRADFLKQCIKGEILYGIHCGGCHNVKVKRKMVIPDFTPEQVVSYDMRLANKAHQAKLDGDQVTTEELVYILSFLTYKKKIGVPAIIGEENPPK